ncbi:MAG: ABC transporter permease [Microthrixaceae bacterium]|nr:ABC transporter permease [Microthrixaceae bacterium]
MSDTGAPPRSALATVDLVDEALSSAFARPGRALLTALGTVLGIVTLVATAGLSRTAGQQIVDRFDELAASTVDVQPATVPGGLDGTETVVVGNPMGWDAAGRVARLAGVDAAATLSDVPLPQGAAISAVPVIDPGAAQTVPPTILAASPNLLASVRGELAAGRFFDSGHDRRADQVAVLGVDAAAQLGIGRLEASPAILIGDDPYSVIGIIARTERNRELLDAVVVPEGTAKERLGLAAPSGLVVETSVGAAGQVADQVPLALSPNEPDLITATAGWEPSDVRRGVTEDVSGLFLVLGGVALLVGMLGIANVTLVSVLERTGEIGLRRALGAGRRHIAAQFLAESAVLGTLAGMVGSATGVVLTVGVAANRGWTPVLDPWLPLVAVVLGSLAGLLAGAYPAWRAARLQPVDALRSAT